MRAWIYRVARWLPWLTLLLLPALAQARGGGGEHYNSGNRSSGGSSSGGGDGDFAAMLIWLVFKHPAIGIPVLLVVIAVVAYRHHREGSGTTRRALDAAEAQARTAVTGHQVLAWVQRLKAQDPAFELLPLYERAKRLFLDVQTAWLKCDLSPVRRHLSDATYQRFVTQLRLMTAQGVRDSMADISVLDVQLIGLEQSPFFDSVHLRIRAQARDTDVASTLTYEQAVQAARSAPLESFTEVWTFVRKPGAQSRIGDDVFQGKCPHCGAPFDGGAANNCTHCGAVVNSGNYDWVLSEITQGMEFLPGQPEVHGYEEARAEDPGLSLEVLEDRASLLFWKWIEAQSETDATRAAKFVSPAFLSRLSADTSSLKQQGRRKVFLDCAVGGVLTRAFSAQGELIMADVELRWSARMGIGPADEKPPRLPTVPQRWVFTLARKRGAKSKTDNGMSTNRCAQCNAPTSDSGSSSCEYCGALLGSPDHDWVLDRAVTVEAWRAPARRAGSAALAGPAVLDVHERERMLYMMAAMAASDGAVDAKELKLLKLCASRWSVSWPNVEMALTAGPRLFDRLVEKGSAEAETFLSNLVALALVDGRVDAKERRMLQAAAEHLGVADKLPGQLAGR